MDDAFTIGHYTVEAYLPETGSKVAGMTVAELEALGAAGAVVVRLGRTVLRSSSAGPAALAVLSATDRWR